VVDLDLTDAEAAGGGEDGDEAVQLAVELDLAKDLGAVALHAAVVIVQLDISQPAHHAVEDPAGEDLVPGVTPDPLPPGDDVERLAVLAALIESGEEARDLRRVVLEVGVEREDDLTPGGTEARRQGRGLAEVSAEAQTVDGVISAGEIG